MRGRLIDHQRYATPIQQESSDRRMTARTMMSRSARSFSESIVMVDSITASGSGTWFGLVWFEFEWVNG